MNYLLNKDNYVENEYLNGIMSSSNTTLDSVLSNTTDFYKIKVCAVPKKDIFDLNETKSMTITITNYGTKDLYLPEYFKHHDLDNNPEILIVIYRKKGNKYKKYIQKRMSTHTHFQPNLDQNRAVYQTKQGKKIIYDDVWIDTYKKIVDPGDYAAKIYIDLSNFGYFKVLNSEFYFKVKE